MLPLFTYKTPAHFNQKFKISYNEANVQQVKTLSIVLLVVTLISRIIAVVYYNDVIQIERYGEYSLINWFQISGSTLFLILSKYAIRSGNWSQFNKKALALLFIVFVLLSSFYISYVVSMYNTKNTLTMFLIGIVAVSLFFVIEYKEIFFITCFIIAIFFLGIVLPKITFQDKLMNVLAGIILGFILICFSRYNYYLKSQQFIKIKELEVKNLEIERLNTQKGEILSFVAHDLRNPLNNIEALSGFMLLENENNNEAQLISKAAQQAKEIINDLIEVVKAEEPVFQTLPKDISTYLTSIIQKWKNSKREVLLVNHNIQATVLLNASKFERVMDNLISNAIKFSPEDQPIEIGVTQQKDKLNITVKDYGIGIPKELQSLIFNQFSKAGRKGLQGEKSIGLGLHISKKIVEQHNGTLNMSSQENEGTVFTIVLPIA